MVTISHVLKRAGWGLLLTAKERYKSNATKKVLWSTIDPWFMHLFSKETQKLNWWYVTDKGKAGAMGEGNSNEYNFPHWCILVISHSPVILKTKFQSFFQYFIVKRSAFLPILFPLSLSLPLSAGGVMFSHLPTQVGVSAHRGSRPHVRRPPSSRLARLIRLPAFS